MFRHFRASETSSSTLFFLFLSLLEDAQLPFHIMGMIYTFLFAMELILRLAAYGFCGFFCREDWAWSLLDALIVLTSLWEVTAFIIDSVTQNGTESLSGISSLKAFRIIRRSP